MAIREDLVASAAQFLQDPSVAASSVDNRIAFLRTKNLTQEEIDAALARAGSHPSPSPASNGQQYAPLPAQYQQPYPGSQYVWQQPPPPVPKRDWRDWFIMATVMGGVGYGLYTLGKRYVYPLVAPPTPERLQQDKKSIEEQFEKAFALMDQLAKDTEALKTAEQERTERLDNALSELESVMRELKSANRRREDEAQRMRDDIYTLKDSIPKALSAQSDLADTRLKQVNTELTSLKTLITQRMNSASSATSASYLRPAVSSSIATPSTTGAKAEAGEETTPAQVPEQPTSAALPTSVRPSPFSSGSTTAKASIPAWQLAMANKTSNSSPANGVEATSSSSQGDAAAS